ncbi:MAG: PHP domain-containing protein [Lachnospiraceae bacterium]|nr:PHP domain-containing protein [Lachnospiraceae bacterium]
MNAVDLHVHSNKSDGTFTPSQLVDYALEKGLSAFALTDHDTVDGLEEAITYADKLRKENPAVPEVIPGIELSTEYQGKDIHIVGLYIDYTSEKFLNTLKEFVSSRDNRNRKMCDLLAEHGIAITYEKLLEEFPDCVITRAHYARYMLNRGYINNMTEAFDKYIGDRCPCYVPREKITPQDGITMILEAGGVPILAHPMLYRMSDARLEELVALLAEHGLMGIEAVYTTNTPAEERQTRKLAGKYHLLISGGSDFHGSNKPKTDLAVGHGKLFVPEDILINIKRKKR